MPKLTERERVGSSVAFGTLDSLLLGHLLVARFSTMYGNTEVSVHHRNHDKWWEESALGAVSGIG